ncbi:MAG TPA: hypothetical protein PK109_01760, partial [Candidatus Paceibacterota bacterium]|nr:hypothetical protein [Candidatus Paceibacterota bacterium]
MTTEPTVMAPAPVVPPTHHSTHKGLLITLGILILISLAVGAAWYLRSGTSSQEPVTFRVLENGTAAWYTLSGDGMSLSTDTVPSWYTEAPASVTAGTFSPAAAGNGSVVALSSTGLESIDAANTKHASLITRAIKEWSSSVVVADASLAVLFNTATNAFDVFSLDSERPTVLSYEGSIAAPELFYGVGALPGNRVVVRVSENQFDLYEVHGGTASLVRSLMLAEAAPAETSFFSIPVAYAWTYGTPLTSTSASTAGSTRCTGAVVASLGGTTGTGAMPSIQTMAWNYMGAQSGLPANYNNGSYCIQAVTTITTGGGGGGG